MAKLEKNLRFIVQRDVEGGNIMPSDLKFTTSRVLSAFQQFMTVKSQRRKEVNS